MLSGPQPPHAHIEEILQQLDCSQQEAVDDRRGSPRLKVRMSLNALVLSDAMPVPIPIYSRNFSSGGIGFVSRRMLKAGERIAIPLKLPNGNAKLLLACVTFVRYVRKGLHEVGAEFLEAIDDPGAEAHIPSRWVFDARASRSHDSEPAPPSVAALAPNPPAPAASPAAPTAPSAAPTSPAAAPAKSPEAPAGMK